MPRLILFLAYCSIALVPVLQAQTSATNEPLFSGLPAQVAEQKARYQNLKSAELQPESGQLDQLILSLSRYDIEADGCITYWENRLADARLITGELVDNKAADNPLKKDIQHLEDELARCRQVKLETEAILTQATEDKQAIFKARLLSREPGLLPVLASFIRLDAYESEGRIASVSKLIDKLKVWKGWSGLLLSFLLGGVLGTGWLLWEKKHRRARTEVSSVTLRGIFRGFARTAPWLLGVIAMQLFLLLDGQAPVVVQKLTLVLLLMFLVFAAIRGLLTFDLIDKDEAQRPFLNRLRYLSWLMITVTATNTLFNLPLFDQVPDAGSNYLIWFGTLMLSVLTTISLLRLLSRGVADHSGEERVEGGVRVSLVVLLTILLLLPVVVGAFGYRNLAAFVLFGLYASMLVGVAFFLLAKVGPEFLDSLDSGKLPWHQKMKASLGLTAQQAIPGLIWVRVLLFVVLLFGAGYLLMMAWGASSQQLNVVAEGLLGGFDAAGIHFDPLRLLLAVLLLVVAFALLPLFRQLAVESWISHTKLSRGAREATQTLVGYGWIAIGLMLALSLAGVNFQNIAIIAGALSLGIGFGLQNIVNNFVSGLILLFERPVRRGDWVEVGGTEGYVRDISIRSTVIQTFDRADVIVPNSELISNQVTNWVLKDTYGRMTAPVGVAYDTDPARVVTLLDQIARAHPEVISDRNDFPIRAFFRRFGDSALEFELRCFLRDVDSRTRILHEINMEIYRVFMEEGVEIPFPQRTVHLNSV